MVTARLAIGSVSTLAVGALLLGSASYWMHRGADGSRATPWGSITSLDAGRAEAAQPEDRAQLLKMAALKATNVPDQPTLPVAAPDPVPAPQPVAQVSPAPPAIVDAAPVVEQAAPQAQQVASIETPAAGDAAQDTGAAKSDRININTASSDALDHLPGTGRIGHTIVSHRPYKAVKDLVSRRILRTSDFQKIQARISVD